MNSPIEPYSLDDVLDAYTFASQEPKHEVLIEFIRRYPEFEQELIDFTMAWMEMDFLPSKLKSESENISFIQLGLVAAEQAFHQQQEKKRPNSPFQTILEDAKSKGISADQLANFLNISIILIRKMDLRAITYHTIPFEIIHSLAENLKRNVREVARYLTLPPLQPTTARYKSYKTPKLDKQRSFFDEVRDDPILSEEQRHYWLLKEPQDKSFS